jgi:hypothetical protein
MLCRVGDISMALYGQNMDAIVRDFCPVKIVVLLAKQQSRGKTGCRRGLYMV